MLAQQSTLKRLQNLAPATITWAEQMDELKVLWENGTPTDDIAYRLGRTRSSVLTQAVRAGLERRAPSGRKPHQNGVRIAKPAVPKTNVLSFPVRSYSGAVVGATAKPEKKSRTCLMCTTSFLSHGSHNRICNRCKDCTSYQSGHEGEYQILSA